MATERRGATRSVAVIGRTVAEHVFAPSGCRVPPGIVLADDSCPGGPSTTSRQVPCHAGKDDDEHGDSGDDPPDQRRARVRFGSTVIEGHQFHTSGTRRCNRRVFA
jgi:hypothetical protein